MTETFRRRCLGCEHLHEWPRQELEPRDCPKCGASYRETAGIKTISGPVRSPGPKRSPSDDLPEPVPRRAENLVDCGDCGRPISKRAPTCPHCGAPSSAPLRPRTVAPPLQKKTGTSPTTVVIASILAVIALPPFCNALVNPDSGSGPASLAADRSDEDSMMAYIMMEDFVRASLKSPSTAKFPGVFDGRADHVKRTEHNRYLIVSYVDSQNGFGAMLRTNFTGEIEKTSSGQWRLVRLEFGDE